MARALDQQPLAAMHQNRAVVACFVLFVAYVVIASACQTTGSSANGSSVTGSSATRSSGATAGDRGLPLGGQARHDLVMTSAFCASCHPDIYAEHAQNTHGRAFTDQEVRLATGDFQHDDCIRCHTPRPVFETGIGMNPQRRFYGLEDGNSCMTCHWRQGVDYSRFHGGAECRTAFDPRVGAVEACASCHRNHGTPYQWALAPAGKGSDRKCIDCHMPVVERPVAIGGPVRSVRSHVFPAGRSERQLHRAYGYDAKVVGNEVVVTIDNHGAGHNFPTELKQRSVESLVVVRDADGKEVARSRMVFRDPYKRPYGLHLQVNTQIPAGESREHRVPIKAATGTVDCELHYKLYYPIEDNHPDLGHRLEQRRLTFDGVTPSDKDVVTEAEVKVRTPEGISARDASVANLSDFARPAIGKTEVDIPSGNTPADIKQLIDLFMFPVPQANRTAMQKLVAIGAPAVPALVEALGSWDNKTFNQSMKTLRSIGAPAVPAVRAALRHQELYVRLHARMLLARLPLPADRDALITEVLSGLQSSNALDRRSAAELLPRLGAIRAAPRLRQLLLDFDPDVAAAAAHALADLGDRDAVPGIRAALAQATFAETRIDLATSLSLLGSTDGMPVLLENLDHGDELIRQDSFEQLFDLTGKHFGFDPHQPRDQRLAAIASLQAWWARDGGAHALRHPYTPEPATFEQAFTMVVAMDGGDTMVPAAEDDQKVLARLVALGQDARLALRKGLKFPPGFANKRALVLTAIHRIGDQNAAPFACQALRDPVLGVAAYAVQALESCGDADCLPALRRFQARVLSTAAAGQLPANIPSPDRLLAATARTRLLLGDDPARSDLVNLLLSDDDVARATAITTLQQKFGDARGYDAAAAPAERRRAAARWTE